MFWRPVLSDLNATHELVVHAWETRVLSPWPPGNRVCVSFLFCLTAHCFAAELNWENITLLPIHKSTPLFVSLYII
jgi:hypothetical protein